MDLALNNLERMICHKPKQPTNQPKQKVTIHTQRHMQIHNHSGRKISSLLHFM